MKRNSVIDRRRTHVSDAVRERVDLSFRIVDRIHVILTDKGLKQKDLAEMLGKKEPEISKWMRGTHNFTIGTIAAIEAVLGEPILRVCDGDHTSGNWPNCSVGMSLSRLRSPSSWYSIYLLFIFSWSIQEPPIGLRRSVVICGLFHACLPAAVCYLVDAWTPILQIGHLV